MFYDSIILRKSSLDIHLLIFLLQRLIDGILGDPNFLRITDIKIIELFALDFAHPAYTVALVSTAYAVFDYYSFELVWELCETTCI